MTILPNVVGITGMATHGKDTVADFLVDEFGYIKVGYADKLKKVALACNPWVRVDFDVWVDEELIWISGTFVKMRELVAIVGWDEAKKHSDVREFLQLLGTEGGRENLGENVWVNALVRDLDPRNKYVMADVRFLNEVEATNSLGGEMWRVIRSGVGIDQRNQGHVSESGQSVLNVQWTILNDGTIEDLHTVIKARLQAD